MSASDVETFIQIFAYLGGFITGGYFVDEYHRVNTKRKAKNEVGAIFDEAERRTRAMCICDHCRRRAL